MRILFCNTTWMINYQGAEREGNKSLHGGSHIAETGFGAEEFNFMPFGGKYLGFVITAGSNKHDLNQMNISRLEGGYDGQKSMDGVLVVWVAYNESMGKNVIVGWYKNATVYRHYQYQDIERERYAANLSASGRPYIITARVEDGVLLTDKERTFIVPRARGNAFGMGQSNVWYAGKNESAVDYVKKVIEFIAASRQ